MHKHTILSHWSGLIRRYSLEPDRDAEAFESRAAENGSEKHDSNPPGRRPDAAPTRWVRKLWIIREMLQWKLSPQSLLKPRVGF